MNLFLAITCYDHKVYDKCSESILKNCLVLIQNGHMVTPYYNSELYIDLSRNFCISLFLDSNCSDIIFVDSDLGFDDDAILKLIKFDKDIVTGAYRYKKTKEEYPVILDFSRGNNCKEEETGLVYVQSASAGLMRIQRRALEKLINYYKMRPDKRGIYPFFATGMIFENDNSWYGEDTAFCKKWREMGGEIFVEPNINFTHIGNQDFKGNLHEYLLSRRVDTWLDNLDKQEGIDGWTSGKELSLLRKLASDSQDVIEIGSWKGRSTKALLESCKGTVYAVDHWKGTPDTYTGIGAVLKDVYQEFMDNVGHYPNLKVLKGYSVDIANSFDGNKVDMIFIDGGHAYEECKADIEAWLPKCKKYICGHDYQFSTVKKAVTEKFTNVNATDTLWWVRL